MQLPFFKKKTKSTIEMPTDNLMKIRIAVILSIGIFMSLIVIFLYRDFYQTIIQAKVVVVLKQEVALENIDLTIFNRVHSTHEYKISTDLPSVIDDPFKTTR